MGKQLTEVLHQLERTRFLIVIGEPGIDEISISGPTHVFEGVGDVTKEYKITPSEFGIIERDYSTIPGGDRKRMQKYSYLFYRTRLLNQSWISSV